MNKKGFTLMELLVTVVVLGIIVGLSLPLVRNIRSAQTEKRYITYLDSVGQAAKLYTDSYSEDLYLGRTSGCVYVSYDEMNRYKLLKDIDIRDISCNSEFTAVKIVKFGEKYYYKPFIGCGTKKNGKASNPDIFRPSQFEASTICNSEFNQLIAIRGEPASDDSITNKTYGPKVKLVSETGVNKENPPRIFYGYSYDQSPNVIDGLWTPVNFKIPSKSAQLSLIRKGVTQNFPANAPLNSPTDQTGDLYLVIRVDLLEDLNREQWRTAADNYVYIGPYRVDNEAPVFNDSIIKSSAGDKYQSKTPKLDFKVVDEHFSEEKDMKMCYSYDDDDECPLPSSAADLAEEMTTLGEGFIAFSDVVEEVPEDTADKASKIAEIIKTLANSFSEIPNSKGIAQVFTGYVDIDLFVEGMLNFAKALGEGGLEDVTIPDGLLGKNGKVTKIVEVMAAMSDAAKKIPKSGGVQQAFTGNTTLEEFAEQLASFAESMSTFFPAIKDMPIPKELVGDNGKIAKICEIIGQLSTSAAEIPPSLGIKQIITGNTTISEFATMLAMSVPGISHFISAAQYIVVDDSALENVKHIAKAIKYMAIASQELPETGGFKQVVFGGQEVNTFASQLAAAVPGLQDFFNQLPSITIDKDGMAKIPSIKDALIAMAEVAKALPKSGGVWQRLTGQKDIGDFGKKLGELIDSLGSDKIKKSKINKEAISSTADALNTIIPAIQSFKAAMPIPTGANLAKLGENAHSFAESLGKTDTKGIGSKATAISNASKKLAENAAKGAKAGSKSSDLSASGGSIADSFLKGFKNKLSSATAAG